MNLIGDYNFNIHILGIWYLCKLLIVLFRSMQIISEDCIFIVKEVIQKDHSNTSLDVFIVVSVDNIILT